MFTNRLKDIFVSYDFSDYAEDFEEFLDLLVRIREDGEAPSLMTVFDPVEGLENEKDFEELANQYIDERLKNEN